MLTKVLLVVRKIPPPPHPSQFLINKYLSPARPRISDILHNAQNVTYWYRRTFKSKVRPVCHVECFRVNYVLQIGPNIAVRQEVGRLRSHKKKPSKLVVRAPKLPSSSLKMSKSSVIHKSRLYRACQSHCAVVQVILPLPYLALKATAKICSQ